MPEVRRSARIRTKSTQTTSDNESDNEQDEVTRSIEADASTILSDDSAESSSDSENDDVGDEDYLELASKSRKRKPTGSSAKKPSAKRSKKTPSNKSRNTNIPVSYTHLDVYKRQVLPNPISSARIPFNPFSYRVINQFKPSS